MSANILDDDELDNLLYEIRSHVERVTRRVIYGLNLDRLKNYLNMNDVENKLSQSNRQNVCQFRDALCDIYTIPFSSSLNQLEQNDITSTQMQYRMICVLEKPLDREWDTTDIFLQQYLKDLVRAIRY